MSDIDRAIKIAKKVAKEGKELSDELLPNSSETFPLGQPIFKFTYCAVHGQQPVSHWNTCPYTYITNPPVSLDRDMRTFLSTITKEEISVEAWNNTPGRWMNALREMTVGYFQDPKEILAKEFDEQATGMVIDADIPFYSLCEHHLMPFHGKVAVGYIPNGKVVGLSKLPRLVECFARRLQLQERMTDQIADALNESLEPKGVMVVIEATHTCSSARGIGKENTMVTSAIRGEFEKPEVRAEFLSLALKRNGK